MTTCILHNMGFLSEERPTPVNIGVFCLVAVLASSCGGLGKEMAISEQPLAGTINGQSWSVGIVTGRWDPYSAFGNEYSFTMYPMSLSACATGSTADLDPLVVLVPGAVGRYPISKPDTPSGQGGSTESTSTYPSWQPYPSGSGGTTGPGSNVAVYFASGLRATGGHIVISAVSTTAVVGGADITFDTNDHLNGQFQSTSCP